MDFVEESRVEFIRNIQKRNKQFVIRSITFYRSLPLSGDAKIFGNQFLRSSSSMASNYRAACRARSKNEFFAKMCIVVEEVDEALFWLEIMREVSLGNIKLLTELEKEGSEILAIMATARKNAKP